MPGLSLSPRGITNPNCNFSQSRTIDQMCRQDSRVALSPEEAIAAEASLLQYCKPVELYNILERRAVQNPSFLQRCLDYKIKAKHRRRIKMTVSLLWSMNKGVQVQTILPLYAVLVTAVSELAIGGHSAVYCCRTRARMLTCSSEFEKDGCSQAEFVLPEIDKLSDQSKSGKFFVLLVSCANKRTSHIGGDLNGEMNTSTSPASVGGYCLWGTIPLEWLYSWESSASLRSEDGAGMPFTVDMRSFFLESTSLEKEQCITIRSPDNPVTMQIRVNVFAQENGKDRSPYASFTHRGVHASSPPYITRLRAGNVVFNYMYHNNTLQKTEVTEDFSCPFCLGKCASYKGLRYHLCASHDLFNFEFWVTEEFQAVNVSVRNDIWRYENVTDEVDPKLQTFHFCKKPLKRTSKSSSQNAKHVRTCDQKLSSSESARNGVLAGLLEKETGTSSFPVPITTTAMDAEPSNQPSLRIYDNDTHSSKERDKTAKPFINETDLSNGNTAESNGVTNASFVEGIEHVASSPNVAGGGVSTATTQYSADPECLPPVSGRNLAAPAMLQFAKSRKLSADRSDPRNRLLLQKRQFFHSHRAQPMELEQVLSDRDSEDEVDDDIADFEDRRMLDDFVDVTRDEKQIMHLWNSFVRKQRVLADGHIPWACEAFTKLHRDELGQSPALLWSWRLFLIKLWNHSLLDACTMDKCNSVLSKEMMDPSKAIEVCSHDRKGKGMD